MTTYHPRRGRSNVIAAKRDHGRHRAGYDPDTGVLTVTAHGSGHDVIEVGPGWTRAMTEAALAAYDFRCCEVK
jgi:hypothetical protein